MTLFASPLANGHSCMNAAGEVRGCFIGDDKEVGSPGGLIMRRIVSALLISSLLLSTGCWWSGRNKCNQFSKTSHNNNGMMSGCNECQTCGSPEMFGTPMSGGAMMQAPGNPIDERLSSPAKQVPYEGPAKK